MGRPSDYPWTLNLVWKLLHNDPGAIGLFSNNPFPNKPPRYVRAVLYIYAFAPPGNPAHAWWNRKELGLWLPPLSADDPRLVEILREEGWGGK
jgi:Lipase maturation factor